MTTISVAELEAWLSRLPTESKALPVEAVVLNQTSDARRIVYYTANDGNHAGVAIIGTGTHLPEKFWAGVTIRSVLEPGNKN